MHVEIATNGIDGTDMPILHRFIAFDTTVNPLWNKSHFCGFIIIIIIIVGFVGNFVGLLHHPFWLQLV